jgi:hypothetical protein
VSAAPILALLLARVRNGIRALRAVAISVISGLALYYAYLIAPPFGARALAASALAIVAIGLLFAAAAGGLAGDRVTPGRAVHGS